ncbi:MAG: NADH-quinone oxidoreductase subunit J [Planctomycetes bacterium]|nr:NADH-quinone oxidoreductase subunit J [Planctomycetota bacterium]
MHVLRAYSTLAALTGALMVGSLTLVVVGVFQNPAVDERPKAAFTTAQLESEILTDQHMAHLGAQLFSTHLVAVEVAGTLLLVALVGTVAIVAQIRKPGGPSHE